LSGADYRSADNRPLPYRCISTYIVLWIRSVDCSKSTTYWGSDLLGNIWVPWPLILNLVCISPNSLKTLSTESQWWHVHHASTGSIKFGWPNDHLIQVIKDIGTILCLLEPQQPGTPIPQSIMDRLQQVLNVAVQLMSLVVLKSTIIAWSICFTGLILYTVSQKKVAHHTLQNILAQGWPIAKISTATESEIISEHKCIINVLIFNVPKCCHLAN